MNQGRESGNKDRFNTAYYQDVGRRTEKSRLILGFWLGQLGTFIKTENTEEKEFGVKKKEGFGLPELGYLWDIYMDMSRKKSEKVRQEI